jgi:hypothetical protein
MKALKNIATGIGTVGELFGFLWVRKLWWWIPLVATLLVVAALLLIGQASGVGPFIYTLF